MWNVFKENVNWYWKNVLLRYVKELYKSFKTIGTDLWKYMNNSKEFSIKALILELGVFFLIGMFFLWKFILFCWVILPILFTIILIIYRTIVEYLEEKK